MNKANISGRELLSYDVITAASEGDLDAINQVVNHYRGYITYLSKIDLYDEFGNQYEYFDEEKRQMLEIKLITKSLCFKADQVV